jgi:hypothetical protein
MKTRVNITINKDLHDKHKGKFSAKVRECLKLKDTLQELKEQYPNDQIFGAVVRSLLNN